jgi:AbrB family looped-hinge helix DNA binding protein
MLTVKISTDRRVTIPKSIFDALGLREGQFVEVTCRNGVIIIKPTDNVDFGDILIPADKASLRRGLAQVKRGESIPWDEVKRRLKL